MCTLVINHQWDIERLAYCPLSKYVLIYLLWFAGFERFSKSLNSLTFQIVSSNNKCQDV